MIIKNDKNSDGDEKQQIVDDIIFISCNVSPFPLHHCQKDLTLVVGLDGLDDHYDHDGYDDHDDHHCRADLTLGGGLRPRCLLPH